MHCLNTCVYALIPVYCIQTPTRFVQAKPMFIMGFDAYMDTQPQVLLLVPVEPLIALAAQLQCQCSLLEIQAHS